MSAWIERPSENGRRELWSVGFEPMILVFLFGLGLTLYTPRALLGSLVVVQDGLVIWGVGLILALVAKVWRPGLSPLRRLANLLMIAGLLMITAIGFGALLQPR